MLWVRLLLVASAVAVLAQLAAARGLQQRGDRSERSDRFDRNGRHVRLLRDPKPDATNVEYNCWDPALGLSTPTVTIVTIMLSHNQAQQFVNRNRKSYVLHHGYRYCELNTVADPTRISAFAKLPLMLALLPCTDYVIHVDGDAIFANQTLSFGPWLAHMQARNVDLLLSEDCIIESPINFGVFAMRPAPWLHLLFKQLYNRCACDWSRLNDWPAEQGMLYDLLVNAMNTRAFKRVEIAKYEGWNRFYAEDFNGTNMLRPEDMVVHMTGIPKQGEGGDCGSDPTCKFEQIAKWYAVSVKQGVVTKPIEWTDANFTAPHQCLPIEFKPLISAEVTYANRPNDRLRSSFMDYQTTRRGLIDKIIVGEVPCIGWRDSKCDLKYYWEPRKGRGPWMPKAISVLEQPPLDGFWAHREQNSQVKAARINRKREWEDEMKRRAEEERKEQEAAKQQEEAKRQKEQEEAKRKEEEAKQKEEESKRKEEEAKRQEEEAKRKVEEAKRKEEEEKQKAQGGDAKAKEEEAKRKAAEEEAARQKEFERNREEARKWDEEQKQEEAKRVAELLREEEERQKKQGATKG